MSRSTPPDTSMPGYLYKFRAVNDYTMSIFEDQSLFFSAAQNFNDPFDFLPVVEADASKADLVSYLDRQMKDEGFPRAERRRRQSLLSKRSTIKTNLAGARQVAADALSEVRVQTGVLSLSASPEKVLLWSHYADSHRGICLRFRQQRKDGFLELTQPIVYQAERPDINPTIDDNWTMFQRALLTKADFWSYEEEWRLVINGKKPGSHRFPDGALDGIIFGCAVSKEHEDAVRLAASRYDIEWLRASIDERTFRLNIVRA